MTVDRSEAPEVFDAFAAAVDYFAGQLDTEISDHIGRCDHPDCSGDECDRPATARDYFRSHRGWSNETIEEMKVGYAPPGRGVLTHLLEEGYDTETIRRTGLFASDYTPLWQGRYVFTYFDGEGHPVYAIARCTGNAGGGAAEYDGHPEDYLAGKYAKVRHSDSEVPIEEPIWGEQTLEPGEPVVITEGIADAITAAAAGHSVLSPVTTQFKKEHVSELVGILERNDVPQVFVAADNEPAPFTESSNWDGEEVDSIGDALSIPKMASGPAGGIRTAAALRDRGVDARYVELPTFGAREKMDLDDYLQLATGWDADIESPENAYFGDDAKTFLSGRNGEVIEAGGPELSCDTDRSMVRSAGPLAGARRVSEPSLGSDVWHRAGLSSEENSSRDAGDVAAVSDREYDTDYSGSGYAGGLSSGLWDLDILDVTPDTFQEGGDHGQNPIAHPGGESETYFYIFELPDGSHIAKDYKANAGQNVYTAVTYLLVAEGERDRDRPQGPLSDREVWVAWRTAREKGLLTGDDVIPTRALQYIAADRALYDFSRIDGELPELPAKAHNAALGWLENVWFDENDEISGEQATARKYKGRDAESVYSWQDVRYIYEESKEKGRHAAEELLRSKYDFMTVAKTDDLHLYDPETGVYTDKLASVRAEIHHGLSDHWSTHEKNEIVARLRQRPRVDPQELNGRDTFDEPHICVGNGVLNLKTRELKEHSPDYYFTDRIPVDYDPEASGYWYRAFVDSLVDREADRKSMFEMVGHTLHPEANKRHQRFMILTGETDNGKSEFYRRVADLLEGPDGAEQNVSNVKLGKLAENQFSAFSIHGHMANIAGEVDGKRIRHVANLKDVTGGDKIELEPKGKESYFDSVNATMMFAANDPPLLGERDTDAIASRIVPIELPYKFVENPRRDHHKPKIPSEVLDKWLQHPESLSGFLNLALDGLDRLRENGDVSLPESEEERYEMYQDTADPMMSFAKEALTNEEGDHLMKDDVTALYKEYAAQNDVDVANSVNRTLYKVLSASRAIQYRESKPRNTPSYGDTSLPLKDPPSDGRPRVLYRLSLTDYGLELAESAGLVDEDKRDTGAAAGGTEQDLPLAPSEVSTEHMQDDGRIPAVEGRVASVYADRYGNDAGRLEGPSGGRDFTVVQDTARLLPNQKVRLVGAKLRETDLGAIELEILPDTEIVVIDDVERDDGGETAAAGESPSDGAAVADGGETRDAAAGDGETDEGRETAADTDAADEGGEAAAGDSKATPQVKEQVFKLVRHRLASGTTVSVGGAIQKLGGDYTPTEIKNALDDIAKKERELERKGGEYEVL